MKCPHCQKELVLVSQAPLFNVEQYGTPVNATTKCCGNIVRIARVLKYDITIPTNHSDLKEDDWCNKKTAKQPTKP